MISAILIFVLAYVLVLTFLVLVHRWLSASERQAQATDPGATEQKESAHGRRIRAPDSSGPGAAQAPQSGGAQERSRLTSIG